MCVHTSIASSACEVFIISIRNMLVGLWVTITLGQSEIDRMDETRSFIDTNEEVVRLNISMDE